MIWIVVTWGTNSAPFFLGKVAAAIFPKRLYQKLMQSPEPGVKQMVSWCLWHYYRPLVSEMVRHHILFPHWNSWQDLNGSISFEGRWELWTLNKQSQLCELYLGNWQSKENHSNEQLHADILFVEIFTKDRVVFFVPVFFLGGMFLDCQFDE